MYSVRPLRADLLKYIQHHQLSRPWFKSQQFFERNPKHPSLHTELLEPKENFIYSFRIDRRYRALFIIHSDDSIEIIAITNHYQ